jgi:large subunit ribosomal protein L18
MPTVTPQKKAERRLRRKRHIRRQIFGTLERPRLTVYKSLAHMYAQVIDDVAGRTLVAASTLEQGLRGALKGTGNCAAASAVGKVLAGRAKGAGISKVVFDRNGFRYHGRVKALADAARSGGLEF